MNWKAFEYKYDKKESWAFEQMSYYLFCAEFDNRIGLFRFKNQAGIETEPIEKEGRFYGFQAKYYTTSISTNKNDIIDAIQKAKNKNQQLNGLYLYINQELSESSTKENKKPQYQLDIEKAAKEIYVDIEWRVPSHLELQLALPENQFIYDIYFNLGQSLGDLIEQIAIHNETILKAIQTEIPIDDNKEIKIDRSEIIETISKTSEDKKNIIISGEGGCGKTALFKEFYKKNSTRKPICVFKAYELNVDHINDVFKFDNSYIFKQFIEAYQNDTSKIFVIDSAEKLAEISNNHVLIELINKLTENDWNIIFTTRYGYLNDLTFHIRENYKLPFEICDVPLIPINNLKSISQNYNFSLPENEKFLERLRNLFYLSEYIQQYSNIDKTGNLRTFIDLLWKKKIQNNLIQKDNLHRLRESSIINIAKKRYETNKFYINGDDLPQTALFHLNQDEILGYSDVHDGYFITHDIYEEWTLDRIVSRSFSNRSSTEVFFVELGNSLPIRRAFRLWLSDQLSDNQELKEFIEDSFINTKISQFWKDEILVSILLSDYSSSFFKQFENEIIENDFTILKRILFLLRIACTDISMNKDLEISKPKGEGWKETILLINKYKSEFYDNNLQLTIPILKEWCTSCNTGVTSRISGLLALSIVQKTETEKKYYLQDNLEEDIFEIIFSTAYELNKELEVIFDKVITNKWNNYRDPYSKICSTILEKPYLALKLIKELPQSVINLCDLFWQKQIIEIDDDSIFPYHEPDTLANRYGLTNSHHFSYFPASANQTPIKWLLEVDFYKTLDFIIDFTNRSIKYYSESDYGKEDVKEITLNIDDKKITQYSSYSIWCMYRGTGSPVTPYLLQSIHMALESFLLITSKVTKKEILNNVLLKILFNSKSTSLTAVVCSVVVANPDILHVTALLLFQTIELFHLDATRAIREHQAETLAGIGYGMDVIRDKLYTDERISSIKRIHRKSSIKNVFFNYQYLGVKGFNSEQNKGLINKLYYIIDKHNSNKYQEGDYDILLANIDRRNLEPKVTENEDKNLIIEFETKELSEEQEERITQANDEFENAYKYTPLRLWGNLDYKSNPKKRLPKHIEYDQDPNLALSETKELIEELKLIPYDSSRFFDYSIPGISCSKLIIEYCSQLSNDDKEYCKNIILDSLSRLFDNEHNYQIEDGIENSVHALPKLIKEYPSESQNYLTLMVCILLDNYPLGAYKRICDYVIEAIYQSQLWKQNFKVAQSILLDYIVIIPIYKSIITNKKKELNHLQQISKRIIFEELIKLNLESFYINNEFKINSITSLDIYDLEIIYYLIPADTQDKIHLEIYEKSLPVIAPLLLMDRSDYKEETHDSSNIYSIRLNIFKSFSKFILHRDFEEVDLFLEPFINAFSATKETASFISEILKAEDILYKYDTFWYIWGKLYPKVKEECKIPRNYNLEKIIINYLLAWEWWSESLKDWHSLKEENISLYADVSKDLGHVPSVLYSISKILNLIGYNYINDGINWIYIIVSNNPSLILDELEFNTLYHLEKVMRRFVYANRNKIKEEILLKEKVIPILDFMIERSSIQAYLIRESIL